MLEGLSRCFDYQRKSNPRYHSLDKLKVLCAFFVVCIHAPFPGEIGEYCIVLARAAVPVFFMISGFFWNPFRIKEQIFKLVRIMVAANIFYFFVDLVKALIEKNTSIYLRSTLTLTNLFKFALLNDSPFAPHLWYLGAIIYVLILYYYAEKTKLIWIFVYATPVLLGCDLLLGKYAILVFNKEFPYIIVRNWLFVGIPYFTIGNIIRQKYYIIEKRVSLLWTSGSVVIFSLTSFLERYLLVITEMNAKRDHYLSTTFLAIALFLLFVYCLNNHESFVSRLGHRDSTWIYILHYLFIGGIGVIARRIGMEHVYSLVKPVVVFFFTVIAIEFANVVLRCLILKNSK